MVKFCTKSTIAVNPEVFWGRTSLSSVNAELAPIVRMTAPKEFRQVPIEAWPIGQAIFRSVILLGGVVPVDVHNFYLEWVDPKRGIRELSSSWLNETWLHERTTLPCQGGCVVLDCIEVKSRLPFMDCLLLPVYRAVFRHRHRRLQVMYGEATE